MKATICILVALMMVFAAGAVGAQDLPRHHFKVIGYHSTVVTSPKVELPFWREHIPKASKGAISADVTPIDHMGIDDKTMLRLLRLGVMDFAMMDISKMAGDDPRFEGVDLAGLTLEADRFRRQSAASVLVPRGDQRAGRPQG